MDVAIMIEGQMGVNWPRWQRMVRAVEDMGFAGLYRSDHFTNPDPPDQDSLELWVSLVWLADHTERIEFGPLVSPVSFRHPSMTARMASAVDNLSNGRLVLGVGAGWQEREHEMFGYDLLPVPERFDRFEEGVHIINHLLQVKSPLDFDGEYYQLHGAMVLPRSERHGGTRILIGGNGKKRTLPLAARYANEWNAVFVTPEEFADLSAHLGRLLEQRGRTRHSVRRSVMAGLVFGRDDADLRQKLDGRDPRDLCDQGQVVGTPGAVQDQLGRYAEQGAERIMLQWLDLDDMDGLELLAQTVL